MDHIILNCRRYRADWRIAKCSSDDNRFGRIYYRGFNDDIGCRGGGVRMINYPKRICIDGTWLGLGGNTPFSGLHESYIKTIEVRDFGQYSSALIEITFQDGEKLRVRTNEYMAAYEKEETE